MYTTNKAQGSGHQLAAGPAQTVKQTTMLDHLAYAEVALDETDKTIQQLGVILLGPEIASQPENPVNQDDSLLGRAARIRARTSALPGELGRLLSALQ